MQTWSKRKMITLGVAAVGLTALLVYGESDEDRVQSKSVWSNASERPAPGSRLGPYTLADPLYVALGPYPEEMSPREVITLVHTEARGETPTQSMVDLYLARLDSVHEGNVSLLLNEIATSMLTWVHFFYLNLRGETASQEIIDIWQWGVDQYGMQTMRLLMVKMAADTRLQSVEYAMMGGYKRVRYDLQLYNGRPNRDYLEFLVQTVLKREMSPAELNTHCETMLSIRTYQKFLSVTKRDATTGQEQFGIEGYATRAGKFREMMHSSENYVGRMYRHYLPWEWDGIMADPAHGGLHVWIGRLEALRIRMNVPFGANFFTAANVVFRKEVAVRLFTSGTFSGNMFIVKRSKSNPGIHNHVPMTGQWAPFMNNISSVAVPNNMQVTVKLYEYRNPEPIMTLGDGLHYNVVNKTGGTLQVAAVEVYWGLKTAAAVRA